MAAAPASPHSGRTVPDYFGLFGIPRRFAIDRAALERRFYELSREAHPDRFAAEGPEAVKRAVERMSLLNEAYRTLKDPIELRRYFLSLEGFEVPAEKRAQIPSELAESWFELQDALAENPEYAAPKVSAFEQQLSEVRARSAGELADIERAIDAVAEGPVPAEKLERLSNAVRAQSYLQSLERDVERIAQRLGAAGKGAAP